MLVETVQAGAVLIWYFILMSIVSYIKPSACPVAYMGPLNYNMQLLSILKIK